MKIAILVQRLAIGKNASMHLVSSRVGRPGYALAALAAIAASACAGTPGESGGAAADETEQVEQPVLSPPGSGLPGATLSRPEVGALGPLVPDVDGGVKFQPFCTGTLIHREFILTAAHCIPYPQPRAGVDQISFRKANGTIVGPIAIDKIWMLVPNPGFPGKPVNSDVLLGHLATPATGITPAVIDDKGVANGDAVSVFGYGGYGVSAPGANPCSNAIDGQKRAVNFQWNTPWPGGYGAPWPICGGDSGGPTFRGSIPGTNLLTLTGNAWGAGSAVHYREEIFEQMRQMLGVTRVPGTTREGIAVSGTPPVAANATACENACLNEASCAAWKWSGSCSLFSAVGRWLPATSASHSSGIRPLFHNNFARAGTPDVSPPVISVTHCAALCGMFGTACKQFNYITSSNTCNLYSTLGAASASTGTISGVRQGWKTGADMAGAELTVELAGSDADCAARCSSKQECRSFTYETASGSCRMKFGTPAATSASGVMSAIKRPVALPAINLEGTAIPKTGCNTFGDGSYVPDPPRAEQCRADCAANTSCVGYRILKPSFGSPLICRLYSAVSNEYPGGGAFDSGYKDLDWF